MELCPKDTELKGTKLLVKKGSMVTIQRKQSLYTRYNEEVYNKGSCLGWSRSPVKQKVLTMNVLDSRQWDAHDGSEGKGTFCSMQVKVGGED